ncbi:cellulose binding domain-containing protein [Microvirga aerilata]|uniref:cellulose binding domain-containing protein n=1 Tax=Microvirga aerilata TaxID=670292 RepID=UPI0036323A18
MQLALNYKDPDVLITVEEKNGDLLFIVELTKGPSNLADLRALFFNVSDSSLLSGLTVANHAITVRDKGSDKVIVSDIKDVKVAKGDGTVVKVGDTGSANINGEGESHTADFGIEFGTPGDGKDDVRIGTFILSHEKDLTLDLIDEEFFAVRLMAVGPEGKRNDSLKLFGTMPKAADGGQTVPPGGREDTTPGGGDQTTPPGGNEPSQGQYDDLIEAGDGDDIIHGGRGNDEMQGEAGNDTIIGGTDDGRLAWTGAKLTKVTIGDNLYGNDGNDTYFYEKGDGVDLIWDFRPDDDTVVLGYSSKEIIGATYVRGVTNRIETQSHDKIALILGKGDKVHDAIVINDFGGLRESDRKAFVFADGVTLSMRELLALTETAPVATALPATWTGVAGSAKRPAGRAVNSVDLFGSNDADTLLGRAGDDRLYGNEGFNQLNGNDGYDELYGGNVSDVMIGGKGDDLGYGNGGADTVIGGVGSDKLYGAGGADIIYGDTDGAEDGRDISHGKYNFKFGLDLGSKYRDLFKSAEPVNGIEVSASPLAIGQGKNWWGGFEITLTITADASLAGWSLFLNSAYEITSVWGAEMSKLQGGNTSALYQLKNAPWNGSLAMGQTTTVGFTVRTPFNAVIDDASLLLKGLKIGREATLDAEVAGALSFINEKLSKMPQITASDDYTLTGTTAKLVAVSGNKAIDLVGNKLGNVIIGNDGTNEIAGRAGKDVLTGKKGKDSFVFDSKLSKANVDKITDFKVADDSFLLENALFTKVGKGSDAKPGKLKKAFFTIGDGAKDENDYIIYNKQTGDLSYDADGSGDGNAVVFATISKSRSERFMSFDKALRSCGS